jgi:hypothetical protein
MFCVSASVRELKPLHKIGYKHHSILSQKKLMEKKIPYAVTHEDNIALSDYISLNLVTYNSKFPRNHFSSYADSKPDQFGKRKSCKTTSLSTTLGYNLRVKEFL